MRISTDFFLCLFLSGHRIRDVSGKLRSVYLCHSLHLAASPSDVSWQSNQYEHNELHNSTSHNWSSYVEFVRPPHRTALGSFDTFGNIGFGMNRGLEHNCEGQWFMKLKAPLLLYCRGALMESLLSNQNVRSKLTPLGSEAADFGAIWSRSVVM